MGWGFGAGKVTSHICRAKGTRLVIVSRFS